MELETEADELGFAGVMSGPLVRSSYRAGGLYQQALESGRGSAALPQRDVDVTLMAECHSPEPAKGRLARCARRTRSPSAVDRNIGCSCCWPSCWPVVWLRRSALRVRHRHVRPDHRASSFGILTGMLAVLIVFGRRAERAAYAQVEGQPGAAAAALQMLRRGWEVKPRRVHQEPGRRAPRRRPPRHHPGRRGQPAPGSATCLPRRRRSTLASVATRSPIIDIVGRRRRRRGQADASSSSTCGSCPRTSRRRR